MFEFFRRLFKRKSQDRKLPQTITQGLVTPEQLEILKYATYEQVRFFEVKHYQTIAKVVSLYDGDTCHLVFFYHGELVKFTCRLAGIDCAEKRSTDHLEVEHAQRAADRFHELVELNNNLVYAEFHGFGKYHRLLVTIRPNPEAKSVNQILIDEKLAYEYHGGPRIPFRDWYYLDVSVKNEE